jgi:hypothetical protein
MEGVGPDGREIAVEAQAVPDVPHDRPSPGARIAHKPAILSECEERHRPRGGVRGTRPVAGFDPALHQRNDGKPYVNNFVFTARGR